MTISGRRALSAAAVLFALVGLTLAARPAAAAPVGSDGLIHACYKAKGKPKGALRVVKPGKPCKTKKGERRVSWPAQLAGATPGTSGNNGSSGANGTAAVTREQLLALLNLLQTQAAQIEQLSALVNGITSQVDGLGDVLAGITNGDLQAVIGALPVLDTVCDQLSAVTGQANALRTVISGLGLNGILEGLGGLLEIPQLPAALNPFACSVP